MIKPILEAKHENRTYYFTLESKSADRITIIMYSTDYSFVKSEQGWVNAGTNKNIMVQGLVDAVVEALK